MKNWELYDLIEECIGSKDLALALAKALDADNLNSCLDFIANCYEITLESEDKEEWNREHTTKSVKLK